MSEIPAEARRRLRDLLPWARAEAKKDEGRVEVMSPLAQAQLQYVTEENLGGITIYPAPRGGWHCDVILVGMPPGVPNSLSTQVAEPLATRAAAEARAKDLLVVVLKMCAMPKEKRLPVFLLYGGAMSIHPKMIEAAETHYPQFNGGFETIAVAERAIKDRLAEVCPEGAEAALDSFEDWHVDRKVRLLSVLIRALITGLYVFPPRRDGMPLQSEARH